MNVAVSIFVVLAFPDIDFAFGFYHVLHNLN